MEPVGSVSDLQAGGKYCMTQGTVYVYVRVCVCVCTCEHCLSSLFWFFTTARHELEVRELSDITPMAFLWYNKNFIVIVMGLRVFF